MVLPSLTAIGLDSQDDKVATFDSATYYSGTLEEQFDLCESDEDTHHNYWSINGWVGMIHLDLVLSSAIEASASDIHITEGQPICYTILGDIVKQTSFVNPDKETMEDLVEGILSHEAKGHYVKDLEWDTSYQIRFGPYKDRRFRVSVGRSFDSNFLVFRTIPNRIPTKEELDLDNEIVSWFENSSGAVLVCGATGSGKALKKDTVIVTPTGLKKVKDVEVGDYLFDKDGNLTQVLDLHFADSSDKFYRITFDNGVVIECTGRHLWLIQDNQRMWRTISTTFIFNNPEYSYLVPRVQSKLSEYKGLPVNEREQIVLSYLKDEEKSNKNIFQGTKKEVSELAEYASSLGYYVNKLSENKVYVNTDKKCIFSKIVYIEELEDDYRNYICFEVDSKSHSYLISDVFLATHNSTTMSSILRDIQLHRQKKIITIEKPIEAIYPTDGSGLVVQRAIPEDCLSFEGGLTSALRQNPDYILIGEVRDKSEVNEFLRAAETGHLAMSTIHTVNTVTTLNRIRSLFTGDEQKRILSTLGDVLRGIVNQTLVKSKNGNSRFAVREVLTIDYKIRKLIAEDRFSEIRDYQEKNGLTMEHKLVKAYLDDKCTLEEARSKAPDQIYFDEILSLTN